MRAPKIVSAVAAGAAFLGPLAMVTSAQAAATSSQFHLSGEGALLSGQTEHLRGHLPGHLRAFWLQEAHGTRWVDVLKGTTDRKGNLVVNHTEVGAAEHHLRVYAAPVGKLAGGHTNTLTVAVRVASSVKLVAPPFVTVGASAKVTGTLAPAVSGRKVYLQQLTGAHWVNSSHTAVTSAGGKFSVSVPTERVGSTTWRIYSAVTSTATAAASSPFTVVVRAPDAPPVSTSAIALSATNATVVQNDPVVVGALVTPAVTGRTVTLEQLSGSTWVTAGTEPTLVGGDVQFALPTADIGSTNWRVSVAATESATAATSDTFTLTVTAPELDSSSLTASGWAVDSDRMLHVDGQVSPAGEDRYVALQRIVDGSWQTLAGQDASAVDGTVHLDYDATELANGDQVRLYAYDTSTAAGAGSDPWTLAGLPVVTVTSWEAHDDGSVTVTGAATAYTDGPHTVTLQRKESYGVTTFVGVNVTVDPEDGSFTLEVPAGQLAEGDEMRLALDFDPDTGSAAASNDWLTIPYTISLS